MRKRTYMPAITVLVLAFIGLWLMRLSRAQKELRPMGKTAADLAAQKTIPSLNPDPARESLRKPHLFKSTRYPPETAEEKEMWNWWHAMGKADSKFEWKMPIEFYGMVVDQFGNPVEGADVMLQWTVVGGTNARNISSEASGLFNLRGAQGKMLSVSIKKEGYLPTRISGGSFEYAAFFEENYYVPDTQAPVVFRLQKLMGAEPLYVFSPYAKPLGRDGVPVHVDITKGLIGQTGELAVSLVQGAGRSEDRSGYKIIVRADSGAAFVATMEEFPFLAPEGDYQTELVIDRTDRQSTYPASEGLKLYVRTGAENYAMVGMELNIPMNGSAAQLRVGIYYNPSGSRNLEFDYHKRINPQ